MKWVEAYLVWLVSGELTARSFVTRTLTMLHRKARLSCSGQGGIEVSLAGGVAGAFN